VHFQHLAIGADLVTESSVASDSSAMIINTALHRAKSDPAIVGMRQR
jgi:hypothetical protein